MPVGGRCSFWQAGHGLNPVSCHVPRVTHILRRVDIFERERRAGFSGAISRAHARQCSLGPRLRVGACTATSSTLVRKRIP